jgi:hypothetical protein
MSTNESRQQTTNVTRLRTKEISASEHESIISKIADKAATIVDIQHVITSAMLLHLVSIL